jgi:hypothetical protein
LTVAAIAAATLFVWRLRLRVLSCGFVISRGRGSRGGRGHNRRRNCERRVFHEWRSLLFLTQHLRQRERADEGKEGDLNGEDDGGEDESRAHGAEVFKNTEGMSADVSSLYLRLVEEQCGVAVL